MWTTGAESILMKYGWVAYSSDASSGRAPAFAAPVLAPRAQGTRGDFQNNFSLKASENV